jgi:hypothetical protein
MIKAYMSHQFWFCCLAYGAYRKATVVESLRAHVDARVEQHYPTGTYNMERGCVPPLLEAMLEAQEQRDATCDRSKEQTAYEMKQSTMPDVAEVPENVFENVRPTLVVGEADTAEAIDKDTAVEHAIGSISEMNLQMSSQFENQFVSARAPRLMVTTPAYPVPHE